MIDVASSSSAIEPRMSLILKRSTILIEEDDDLSTSIQMMTGPSFVEAETSKKSRIVRRSLLSKSSVLLTGTSFPILTTSSVEVESKRRPKKDQTDNLGVTFSDTVHMRNHIHVNDLTAEEKLNAWFRKPEYRTVFKNNMKIIHNIEKKEKEFKRMVSKKKREERKRRNKKNQSICSDDTSVETSDGLHLRMEHIIGVHRDDEQGFSVRGLENETAKKRRARDERYMKAKFAVLSIQEDVDDHMFSVQEEYEQKVSIIGRGNMHKKGSKKSSLRRLGLIKNRANPSDESEDETSSNQSVPEILQATKNEFTTYARAQYHNMISQIAESYGNICKKDAENALERGLYDEKTVKAIDWIESEGSISGSLLSSVKGLNSDSSQEDKRRPSTTSTAATEESAALLALSAHEANRFGRMERAKKFLFKLV